MTRTVVRKRRAPARRDNTTVIIVLAIIAVVVAVLLIVLSLNIGAHPSTPSVAEGKTWGQANAPVTIEEYGDFQ
jgi:hypothetical protein